MTPAPISVERLCELLAVMTGSDPNRMTDFPGGCDCQECGCVFIGGDGHEYCAQCEAKRQLLAALPEALHQLAEREAEVDLVRSGLRNRGEYIEGQPPLPLALVAYDHMRLRAEAAERAREEAIAMCKRILNFSDVEMGDGDTARSECAAFLAASGGA